ncbi:MAG: CpaF/VirB11 family protein [Lachnospiraceae bacterium]|nr:CpaF/VirB11 family protein [Lachnospiraceae bacterium]
MTRQLELSREQYGVLWKYVIDEDISDIDCIGHEIWVTKGLGQRVKVQDELQEEFLAAFCQKLATMQKRNFNPAMPLLEAETNTLRISVIHESISQGGRSISIRKSLPKQRFTRQSAINDGYATKEILDFLEGCVKAHFTFVICGNPGSGKTECAKYLASTIGECERVITVEDNLEWHLKKIHPRADVVELKVAASEDEGFSYRDAIKASLRQNPKWLMLSEARGREARSLMEAWSTGICGITTLHTDDVRKIPERIFNMIGNVYDGERMEQQFYSDVDIGIMIGFAKNTRGRVYRRIEQVCYFDEATRRAVMLVEDGKEFLERLPNEVERKIDKAKA